MSKESLIFFNADSVQNQLLKTRFETDGYVPDIIMRSSQIYTILQLVKTCKYGSFLYSSMTDRICLFRHKRNSPQSTHPHKIGMILEKGEIYQRQYAEIPELHQDVLPGTSADSEVLICTPLSCKKATYYKYIVKAYKMVDGKKVITGTSVAVHSITKDGKYGVAKAVSIIKIGNKKNDTEVTLKKGKTAQITAIEIKKDKKSNTTEISAMKAVIQK